MRDWDIIDGMQRDMKIIYERKNLEKQTSSSSLKKKDEGSQGL
jgi:hypothetical protein